MKQVRKSNGQYETAMSFEARIMEHADAVAARLIVIGGLQPMPQE